MPRIIYALLCVGTLGVPVWSACVGSVGGTAVADFKFDTYVHHLDDPQREGLARAFDGMLRWTTVPLALMNLCWAAAAGWYLFRRRVPASPSGNILR